MNETTRQVEGSRRSAAELLEPICRRAAKDARDRVRSTGTYTRPRVVGGRPCFGADPIDGDMVSGWEAAEELEWDGTDRDLNTMIDRAKEDPKVHVVYLWGGVIASDNLGALINRHDDASFYQIDWRADGWNVVIWRRN